MSQNITEQQYFKAGDVIMRQGDDGDCAYIIESGRVEIVLQKSDDSEEILGTRGAGAMIGEMALIDHAPRTATIKAIDDCRLLAITREDFSSRLEKADPIVRMTTQVVLTRYRDTLMRSGIMNIDDTCLLAEALELGYVQDNSALESVKIENDFKTSLKNGDITLHYQPMIDFETLKIKGFEALMRWEHPEIGFISPAQFIPIIEESGFIIEASRWALRESMEALKRIEGKTGRDDCFMSVNFSSNDFASENFIETVYETLSITDIAPQKLHLEITERLLMGQPDQAKKVLEMCREAGMGISIDDFGTGYSSLSYLHHFPIDTLKIDQSFIRNMHDNPKVMALVKSLIYLSETLELKTVAEGVETQEDAKILKDLGCSLAQGYYFAKPMPENELVTLIRETGKFSI